MTQVNHPGQSGAEKVVGRHLSLSNSPRFQRFRFIFLRVLGRVFCLEFKHSCGFERFFRSDYVVHATNGLQQRCIDLNEDALFESGNATLLPGSKEKIEGKIKQMLNGKLKVHKVRVIGHADIQQFSHSRQTNYGLALLRAESIKNLIEGTLHTANGQVVAESKGASEPKVQCSEKLPSPMMRECLSPNRRVEIRAEFTSSQN